MEALTDRYLTVKQVVKEQLYPSENGLRWLLFNSKHNGLHRAVRRVGRRVLLHENEFRSWLDSQREE